MFVLLDLLSKQDYKLFVGFNQLYPQVSGVIIVGLDATGDPKWWWSGHSMVRFGDEGRMEDPKCFYTKRTMTTGMKNAREYIQFEQFVDVQLAAWVHPDAEFAPIAKYENMKNLFPGSPRR